MRIARRGPALLRALGRRGVAPPAQRPMRFAVPPVVPAGVFEARERIARRHLAPGALGLEIGAGSHPQRLPDGVRCTDADKRDAAALGELFDARIDYEVHPMAAVPALFPDGADFLIAHNVLEHAHDPIGTLIGWHAWLRDGGLVILSLPDKEHCPPDTERLPPDAFHLLSDHLFARGPDAFESREHIPGFLAGWQAHIQPDKTRAEYCAHSLAETHRGDHDLHWHALDRPACDTILAAAGALGRRTIALLDVCTPTEGAVRTLGETIYVYRVYPSGSPAGEHPSPALEERAGQALADTRAVLERALRTIDGALGGMPAGDGSDAGAGNGDEGAAG